MLSDSRKYFLVGLFLTLSVMVRGEVIIEPTPDGGMQPRLTLDNEGHVHLLYFKKRINRPSSREGNLYYRQYDSETGKFGIPIKVSSSAFSMQTFSIARASLALTDDGRVHVMWYYPKSSEMIYTRSNLQRTVFEEQRSMVANYQEGIDAGGDIAASGAKVAIVWGAGDLTAEHERTIFVRSSYDSGENFSEEISISNPDLGACACCSLAADYLADDDLVVAYRSAIDGIGRHMQLLTIENKNNQISNASYGSMHDEQKWEASFCPLSTNDISGDNEGQHWLVFETESRIMELNLTTQNKVSALGDPFIETRQKNPAVAINKNGERLITWGEAISHARGGRLNMRLFDQTGRGSDIESMRELNIPDYSFPAAVALPTGDFLVLY
ncbi:hypothetical protein N9478_04895 [Gammaproteobacteria bacterium]|nr:hypothetical protein [Gammaproteobacteria bacterium]